MTSYTIPPINKAFDCTLALPGSKSIALRQLAIAALTEGTTTLRGVPPCDDTDAMFDCLSALGVAILHNEGEVQITGPMNLDDDVDLNARMSGASTRLLVGLAALRTGKTRIDGHDSLRRRTNQPLYDVLVANGCTVEGEAGLPVEITGPLRPDNVIEVDGSISSQYLTALLIISPYLPTATSINLTSDLVSRPYIEITRTEMAKRGCEVQWQNERSLTTQPGTYIPGEFTVEGDATAASYLAALATLHGSRVVLSNLGSDTHQGDYAFCNIVEALGAEVGREPGRTTIQGPASLNELDPKDLESMPDAALTLIAMAPLIPGTTTITGLSTLHHKECDRLECSNVELTKLGVASTTTYDSITVPHTPKLNESELETYHDHRMAMAFSTIGSITGSVTVDQKSVVEKTYPHYWEDYERLRS